MQLKFEKIMKSKLSCSILLFSCIGMISMPVLAAQNQKEVDVEKLVNKITARTNELENEVKQLKAQLHTLRQEQLQAKKTSRKSTTPAFRPPVPSTTVRYVSHRQNKQAIKRDAYAPCFILKKPCPQNTYFNQLTPEKDFAAFLLHGTAVVTSPYLGRRSPFDGSDLVVLNAGANQDVRLLKQEKTLREIYKQCHHCFPENPLLEVSGRVETQAVGRTGYDTVSTLMGNTSSSDINLTAAELDLVPIINEWTTGLIVFKYDNNFTTPRRLSNSRLFLDSGFATIGNFAVTPWYVSLGQMFVPFAGQYSSFMLTTPLPQQLGVVRDRAVLLGYQPLCGCGLYGSVFIFSGDSFVSDEDERNFHDVHHHRHVHDVHDLNTINNGGVNLGFKWDNHCGFSTDLGASYIRNIADALGFQLNGVSVTDSIGFTGFAATGVSERLRHRVPGLDVHSNFCMGNFRLYLEYVAALRTFDPVNLSFNKEGAQPKSGNVEGVYKFAICQRPASVALGFARTWEALALNLPEQQYNAVFNISIWKSTILSLEYRHDVNYPAGTCATGNGPFGLPVPFFTEDTLGKTGDQLTLQFGIYF